MCGTKTLVRLDELAQQLGCVLAEFAVIWTEGGKKMAVNVELADHFPLGEDWNDNLRFGFDGTREIAWILVDVVYNDRLTA